MLAFVVAAIIAVSRSVIIYPALVLFAMLSIFSVDR
jgi:hypothetical protein